MNQFYNSQSAYLVITFNNPHNYIMVINSKIKFLNNNSLK